MVERFNRTLLDMLATTVDDNLKLIESIAYNSSVHSSTTYLGHGTSLMIGNTSAHLVKELSAKNASIIGVRRREAPCHS